MIDISEQLQIIKSEPYGDDVKNAIRDALAIVAANKGGEETKRFPIGLAYTWFPDTINSIIYGPSRSLYDPLVWSSTNAMFLSNRSEFPSEGAASTNYVACDEGKVYTWDGAAYVERVATTMLNLFDYGFKNCDFEDDSGSIYAASVNKLGETDYIPIPDGKTKIQATVTVNNQKNPCEWFFYCYDSNKSYLKTKSSTYITTTGGSYKPWSWKGGTVMSNIPSDVGYVRVGFRRATGTPSLSITNVMDASLIFQ